MSGLNKGCLGMSAGVSRSVLCPSGGTGGISLNFWVSKGYKQVVTNQCNFISAISINPQNSVLKHYFDLMQESCLLELLYLCILILTVHLFMYQCGSLVLIFQACRGSTGKIRFFCSKHTRTTRDQNIAIWCVTRLHVNKTKLSLKESYTLMIKCELGFTRFSDHHPLASPFCSSHTQRSSLPFARATWNVFVKCRTEVLVHNPCKLKNTLYHIHWLL